MMNQQQYAVRIRILYLGLLAVLALGAVASGFAQASSAAAQSQVGPSQRVQLEGELEILQQDFKDRGRLFYSLKLSDGTRVPLQFVKHPPTHLLTGDHVRAEGQLSGGSLVLYSGSTNLAKTTGATATKHIRGESGGGAKAPLSQTPPRSSRV